MEKHLKSDVINDMQQPLAKLIDAYQSLATACNQLSSRIKPSDESIALMAAETECIKVVKTLSDVQAFVLEHELPSNNETGINS